MNRKAVIEVRGLTTAYGETVILDNVSFTVYEGEIFVIVGGSGCGKSTLLRHLIALHTPVRGTIMFDGEDLIKATERRRRELLRKVGVLFQSGALFGSLTLAENIDLLLNEYTSLPDEARNLLVRMKLNLVGLGGFENFLPAEISGGMKKRAGLARALALDPMILFFDEPSAGLDPITSAELDRTILQLNASLGMTIVIVSHELASIFAVAQRVIVLDKKSKGIVAEGTPEELKNDRSNAEVYAFFNREIPEGGDV